MQHPLIERLQKELSAQRPDTDLHESGVVTAVGDGIAEIAGLSNAMLAEMIEFDTASQSTVQSGTENRAVLYGLLLNLEEDTVKAIILGDGARVVEGMRVKRLGTVLSLPVGDGLLGRVVNALGVPVDAKGAIQDKTVQQPIEREAYGVIDRSSVNTPLHTGIKAIDAMIPIGRGQRELIIGDRGTGKTTIAIDTIINQKYEKPTDRPICIYVAIGQKDSKTARIVAELEERGAMEYTTVVTAPASAPAALQFLAAYAGAAIGEYFMQQGKDALVIYDDLSKQAVAYRQLSLLLRRPPGREAYPGDIFYLHSRLLERAAKLSKEKGGGSLTALPIIETQEGDVSAYIPTNVISITDGQIYLEADQFNKGIRPAINVGISVSRVGSSAQTKAMKKVAGKIRLELAQFRELEAFMQFSQDLDPDTKKRIESGRRLTEVLTQGKHVPLPFEEEVIAIFAGIHGYFASVPVEQVRSKADSLLSYIKREASNVVDAIRESRDISAESDTALHALCKTWTESQSS
jgi:F-type H+/Na+-transporting ATPase subunit alpha